MSVVKSSNPASIPQADCCCSAPPTPAFLHPVTQRGGQAHPTHALCPPAHPTHALCPPAHPTHALRPPAHPGQRGAGWGSGVHFGISRLLRVLCLVILSTVSGTFPVPPVISSLSRGSHQSWNRKGRGREWSVPLGLSVHLRADPGSGRQHSGPQALPLEAQVFDQGESRQLLLVGPASGGSVASSPAGPPRAGLSSPQAGLLPPSSWATGASERVQRAGLGTRGLGSPKA